MRTLTKRQETVLEFLESFYAKNGFSPTFEEVAAHFNFKSNNAVTDYVKVLKKKGYLDFLPGKSRNLVPKRIRRLHESESARIPIVGAIAAGQPITASQNVEGHVEASSLNLKNGHQDKFALRVRGHSMVGRGIRDGDIVVIRKQPLVGVRDVAAVRIGGEITLKYVRRDRNNLKLVPDNPEVKTMIVRPEDDVEILGKAVRLLREEI